MATRRKRTGTVGRREPAMVGQRGSAALSAVVATVGGVTLAAAATLVWMLVVEPATILSVVRTAPAAPTPAESLATLSEALANLTMALWERLLHWLI
jgi:hypothetical protein